MGRKNLWAEKAYGQKKPMGRKNLWAEKTYGRKKPKFPPLIYKKLQKN